MSKLQLSALVDAALCAQAAGMSDAAITCSACLRSEASCLSLSQHAKQRRWAAAELCLLGLLTCAAEGVR